MVGKYNLCKRCCTTGGTPDPPPACCFDSTLVIEIDNMTAKDFKVFPFSGWPEDTCCTGNCEQLEGTWTLNWEPLSQTTDVCMWYGEFAKSPLTGTCAPEPDQDYTIRVAAYLYGDYVSDTWGMSIFFYLVYTDFPNLNYAYGIGMPCEILPIGYDLLLSVSGTRGLNAGCDFTSNTDLTYITEDWQIPERIRNIVGFGGGIRYFYTYCDDTVVVPSGLRFKIVPAP